MIPPLVYVRLPVAAGEYLREHDADLFRDESKRKHFHEHMFHGFEFDPTMLRIGAMNTALHAVENPDVSYRDSLSQDQTGDAGTYSLILANPPFAGSLDYEATAKDLQQVVKTKKTELLFLALFLRQLRIGGRAVGIHRRAYVDCQPNRVHRSDRRSSNRTVPWTPGAYMRALSRISTTKE